MRLTDRIARGANNAVFLATYKGRKYIVRKPRRSSDTQRVSNAIWEFRYTAIAAGLDVTPTLYDAWYVRHSTDFQRSGLHFVMEYFPEDLHTLLCRAPNLIINNRTSLRQQVATHLARLADESLFCFDLKPANIVVRSGCGQIKFVDFGRDYCEWRPYARPHEHSDRAPILSYLQRLVDQVEADDATRAAMLYKRVQHAAMLIILSANLALHIDKDRSAMRASFAYRASLNIVSALCGEFRESASCTELKLIKSLMRHREVRDTLRHYMGRRNSGTKRCFHYAGFCLGPTDSLNAEGHVCDARDD